MGTVALRVSDAGKRYERDGQAPPVFMGINLAVEDGEIQAPEQLFYGFGEQQDRLNKLIQGRATVKVSVETGVDVSDRLTALVRELRKYKVE